MTSVGGNVLVTSAGRRVQLVRFFQQAVVDLGVNAKVFATDVNPVWSAACRVAHRAFESPAATAGNYDQFLLQLVASHQIRLIVPTIDTELLRLASLAESLAGLECAVAISDSALITIARDKRVSHGWFQSIGFESPRLLDASALQFPCFAKPYDGSLSRDTRFVQSAAALTPELLADPRMMFMEFLAPENFDEYTVDAYYDCTSVLRCLVPRKRVEVRGGEISKGVAVRGKTYEHLWPRLQRVAGAKGCLTFQFFVGRSESRCVASELNPRFGGGFPLSYYAGANYPEWLIREYFLGERISTFEEWRSGTAMARYDSEVIFTVEDSP